MTQVIFKAPPKAPKPPRQWGWLVPCGTGAAALLIGIGIGANGSIPSIATPTPGPNGWVTATVNVPGAVVTRDVPGTATVTATSTVSTTITAPAPPAVTATATVTLPPTTLMVTPPPPPPGGTIDHDGTYRVGTDVLPGRYRSAGPRTSVPGYFETLKDPFGSGVDNIIANGIPTGQTFVTLASGQGFSTDRMQTWTKVG